MPAVAASAFSGATNTHAVSSISAAINTASVRLVYVLIVFFISVVLLKKNQIGLCAGATSPGAMRHPPRRRGGQGQRARCAERLQKRKRSSWLPRWRGAGLRWRPLRHRRKSADRGGSRDSCHAPTNAVAKPKPSMRVTDEVENRKPSCLACIVLPRFAGNGSSDPNRLVPEKRAQ